MPVRDLLLRGGLALLLLAPAAAAAEPPPVDVTLTVEPEEATVGDPVTVTLVAEAPAGTPVGLPDPGDAWGDLVVLETAEPVREDAGTGRVRHVQRYLLAAYRTGEVEIPPLPVRVLVDGESVEVASPPGLVQVRSVLPADDAGEPADIKPPWFLPAGFPWLPLLAAAAVVAAAAAGWLAWRRRAVREDLSDRVLPLLPPGEEALAALERLRAGGLLERGRVKEYHVILAEICKRYLERRFGVPTRERTSFEVLAGARQRGLEDWLLDRTRALLGACDAVKFARGRPDGTACRAALDDARDLVQRTPPPPAPAESARARG